MVDANGFWALKRGQKVVSARLRGRQADFKSRTGEPPSQPLEYLFPNSTTPTRGSYELLNNCKLTFRATQELERTTIKEKVVQHDKYRRRRDLLIQRTNARDLASRKPFTPPPKPNLPQRKFHIAHSYITNACRQHSIYPRPRATAKKTRKDTENGPEADDPRGQEDPADGDGSKKN
jgi:hypothetical protein